MPFTHFHTLSKVVMGIIRLSSVSKTMPHVHGSLKPQRNINNTCGKPGVANVKPNKENTQ